jgi:GNAT superfamily N-acetyltransferase
VREELADPALLDPDSGIGEIDMIVVDPDTQGKGVGTALGGRPDRLAYWSRWLAAQAV